MKKIYKTVLIIFVILLVFLLFSFVINKTFFKQNYINRDNDKNEVSFEVPKYSYFVSSKNATGETTVKLISLRKVENIEKDIEQYLNEFISCYDESYYAKNDLTFLKYQVNKKVLHNEIEIVYVEENVCEEEFVLKTDWIEDLPLFDEMFLIKDLEEFDKMNIEAINLNEILNDLLNESSRTPNNENIQFEEKGYALEFYKGTMKLTIAPYEDKFLAFKLLDENDHSKNAIYNTHDAETSLFDIYNHIKD